MTWIQPVGGYGLDQTRLEVLFKVMKDWKATTRSDVHFHPECEVFVWRGSPNIPKKLIVVLPYGTITFCSLKVIDTREIK